MEIHGELIEIASERWINSLREPIIKERSYKNLINAFIFYSK